MDLAVTSLVFFLKLNNGEPSDGCLFKPVHSPMSIDPCEDRSGIALHIIDYNIGSRPSIQNLINSCKCLRNETTMMHGFT